MFKIAGDGQKHRQQQHDLEGGAGHAEFPQAQASLVAQVVKHLPAVQETRVQSLGQEGPLEKGMATHSSILAWRIPGTKEPSWL